MKKKTSFYFINEKYNSGIKSNKGKEMSDKVYPTNVIEKRIHVLYIAFVLGLPLVSAACILVV